jgi:PIN domain nuclease of toxin-antitoxin system
VRLLLDAHVWLWMALEPERLGVTARSILTSRANGLFLSIATAWEMAVKHSRGKLELPVDPADYVRTRLSISQVTLLPVTLDHIAALSSLPERHRDPFDRMLVAQAKVEGLSLVTADPHVLAYPVATIDARQ